MPAVNAEKLPANALSARYADAGAFTDCYYIDIPRPVSLQEYILAFYTTPIFKIERLILALFARTPANENDAVELSKDNSNRFSIWTVESRLAEQILLCDFSNKTRSWLMLVPLKGNEQNYTRLYFGSVVIPSGVSKNGKPSFGILFHLLGGFHQIYSRVLLKSAIAHLLKTEK